MPPQISSGAEVVQESPPLSASASTNSAPSNQPSSIRDKQRKLELADQARLIQDNQRVLDLTHETNRRLRQQGMQQREAQMFPSNQPQQQAQQPDRDDMGNILIDSPTTYNYPAPPATQQTLVTGSTPPPAGMSTMAKAALITALALGTGGAGAGAAWLLKPAPAATPVVAPADTQWQLKIVPEAKQ